MSLRIHDTLTNEKRPFETLEPGKVKMYVCGVTPYARCHLGHARCYVVWDLVYRYLLFSGYQVKYVRNFTDVDDKIINRAHERGVAPTDLAQTFIDTFYEDMDALHILRPQVEPRVSTSIPEIIDFVRRLVDRDMAYAIEGSVYYAVERFAGYGRLGKRTLDDMQAGARVEVDERKRNPMDFALWKAAKPGEPFWESPWGPGRPGWHIECSAMSCTHLGEVFDLHGGGRDLVFPHHENELAQSEGASGVAPVRYWMHNGFINIDSEKMSKSLGNVFDVADILKRYEPLVLRWFLLSVSHYRNPINFTDTLLDEASARVGYFYETLRKVDLFMAEPDEAVHAGPVPDEQLIEALEPRFREAMDDDFNAARAVEAVLEAFRLLNELIATRKPARKPAARAAARRLRGLIRRFDEVLGVFGEAPTTYLARHRSRAAARHGLEESWVERRLSERFAARQARDWAAADVVRDELAGRGVVLMDHATGTDWFVEEARKPD